MPNDKSVHAEEKRCAYVFTDEDAKQNWVVAGTACNDPDFYDVHSLPDECVGATPDAPCNFHHHPFLPPADAPAQPKIKELPPRQPTQISDAESDTTLRELTGELLRLYNQAPEVHVFYGTAAKAALQRLREHLDAPQQELR